MTLEFLKNGPKTQEFREYLPKSLIISGDNGVLIVRQNCIMKEVCYYNAFPSTALFSPIHCLVASPLKILLWQTT